MIDSCALVLLQSTYEIDINVKVIPLQWRLRSIWHVTWRSLFCLANLYLAPAQCDHAREDNSL